MSQPPQHEPRPETKPLSADETVLLNGGQPYQSHQQPPLPQQPPPPVHQEYAPQYGQQHAPEHWQQQYPQQQYPQQQYAQHPAQGYGQQQAYPQHAGATAARTKPPVSGAARAIAALMLLAAVVVGIGSVTTWVDAGFASVNGLDGDGVITIVLAAVVALLALIRLAGRIPTAAAVVGLLCGLLTALIGFIDVADVQDSGFDPAYGLWLVVVGGVAVTLLSLAGLVKRR
jgi:hypothetical protein